MRLLVLCLLIFTSIPIWAAADDCETYNPCDIGANCSCTIPADSAYDRYYYSQINGFERGHIYQCKFANSMGITLLIITAKVPDGASLSCGGSCQRFPVTLSLDTRQLVKPVDTMQVKYFVPGSDMPTDLHVHCLETY